jgi:hypothetical protein
MLPVLASLPFIAGLVLAVAVVMHMLKRDGAKIRAALLGRSLLAQPVLATRPVTVRTVSRSRVSQPLRAAPLLRAAA